MKDIHVTCPYCGIIHDLESPLYSGFEVRCDCKSVIKLELVPCHINFLCGLHLCDVEFDGQPRTECDYTQLVVIDLNDLVMKKIKEL